MMERLTHDNEYKKSKEDYARRLSQGYPRNIGRERYLKLAEYEIAEEKGLLPKFHLGDVFWTVHHDGVTKEKIVMLQQKKDGTWKYRFPNTCDYEERDYGKCFFDTKDEAEKFWEERYGSDTNGN